MRNYVLKTFSDDVYESDYTNEELVEEIRRGKNVNLNYGRLIHNNLGIMYKHMEKYIIPLCSRFEDDAWQGCLHALYLAAIQYDTSRGVKFITYFTTKLQFEPLSYVCSNNLFEKNAGRTMLLWRLKKQASDDIDFIDKRVDEQLDIMKLNKTAENRITLKRLKRIMDIKIETMEKRNENNQKFLQADLYKSEPDFSEKVIEKINISSAINRLNDNEKDLIVARFWNDKTIQQIADENNTSFSKIQRKLSKILAKLRNYLEPNGDNIK